MHRTLLFLTVFLWTIVSFAQEKRSTFIKDQPLPMQVVNDFGKFLTKVENVHLERELRSFRERKGYSVVIITLPGLIDNKGTEFTIEEAAQLYFNKWGIGDNVKNDGVLILLSRKPRRIRIHTGSGMATLLTNANCASIINSTMVPNFKADLYFTGLKDAVKEIERYINENEAANSTQADANTSTQQAVTSQEVAQQEEGMTFGKFMYGFITLVTLVWLYFRYRLKKASFARSGVYSGNGYNNGNVVFNNVNRISNNNWGSGWGNSGRKSSWFNSGGSGNSSGRSSSGSSGSSDDRSSSSSSGSASESYGGGNSSGGGASGSW